MWQHLSSGTFVEPMRATSNYLPGSPAAGRSNDSASQEGASLLPIFSSLPPLPASAVSGGRWVTGQGERLGHPLPTLRPQPPMQAASLQLGEYLTKSNSGSEFLYLHETTHFNFGLQNFFVLLKSGQKSHEPGIFI